jgi:ABC-type nickel/cobalt efflux system permease component RcnA
MKNKIGQGIVTVLLSTFFVGAIAIVPAYALWGATGSRIASIVISLALLSFLAFGILIWIGQWAIYICKRLREQHAEPPLSDDEGMN